MARSGRTGELKGKDAAEQSEREAEAVTTSEGAETTEEQEGEEPKLARTGTERASEQTAGPLTASTSGSYLLLRPAAGAAADEGALARVASKSAPVPWVRLAPTFQRLSFMSKCQPLGQRWPGAAKAQPTGRLKLKQIGSPFSVLVILPFKESGKELVLPRLPRRFFLLLSFLPPSVSSFLKGFKLRFKVRDLVLETLL